MQRVPRESVPKWVQSIIILAVAKEAGRNIVYFTSTFMIADQSSPRLLLPTLLEVHKSELALASILSPQDSMQWSWSWAPVMLLLLRDDEHRPREAEEKIKIILQFVFWLSAGSVGSVFLFTLILGTRRGWREIYSRVISIVRVCWLAGSLYSYWPIYFSAPAPLATEIGYIKHQKKEKKWKTKPKTP